MKVLVVGSSQDLDQPKEFAKACEQISKNLAAQKHEVIVESNRRVTADYHVGRGMDEIPPGPK